MKFKEYKLPGFDRPVFLHHNEDWSGMVIVEWWEDTFRRVELPARLILALSFVETKQWMLTEIEGALDDRLGRIPNPDDKGKKR